MDRQEAAKVLMRAGKRQELGELLERKARTAAAAFEEVRSDASRTEEYKKWALAVAASQILRSYEQELTKMASTVVSSDRSDAERVFGVRGIAGDPASLVISRRDAGDRVAAITNPGELRTLLARATRSGDEVLARAIAERAVEMQDAPTVHQFIADRPDLDAACERLWNAERAGNDTIAVSSQLMALKPVELGGVSFDSIEAMARNGEPVAQSLGAW